jgi:two-component system response regulator HupR/HoxA
VGFDWPGNVRELENEVRRFLSLAPAGGDIELRHLSEGVRSEAVRANMGRLAGQRTLEEAVRALEEEMIRSALDSVRGNKVQAARLLGLSREGLRKKMKRYGIE